MPTFDRPVPADAADAAGAAASASGSRYLTRPTRSFWESLRTLSDARFVVAGLLLAYVPLLGRDAALDGDFDRLMFLAVAAVYTGFAVLAALVVRFVRRGFHLQLLGGVLVDIAVVALVVGAAGGAKSGLGLLMLTPVAGAAVLSTPLLSVFVAAIAALALLAESSWRVLQGEAGAGGNEFVSSAVISVVLLATGVLVNRLARRLAAQESLAVRRGADLRNQVAVNELVIAVLDQGVLVFDGRGVLKAMNPKARAILSLAADAPLGQADADVLAAVRSVVDSGRPSGEFAIGDAAHRRLRCRVRVLNAPAASTGPALTDQVVLLEDLEHLEERAQQLKLASMGRLSASIAHEIRNPLGAIRHAGNLLAERIDDERLKRLTTIIEQNSLRIDRIVDDVLSVARRSANRDALSLAAFFNEFLPEFVAQTDTSWERIVVDLASADRILFDPNHLRQVLVNLLSNALRYASDTPGAIRIVWAAVNERQTVLRIMDDGPGISSSQRRHLFEPFHTTESRGTGLGLHMAQELCAANGADLRYESVADGRHAGSFTIEPERVPQPGDAAGGRSVNGDPGRPEGRRTEWQTPMTA